VGRTIATTHVATSGASAFNLALLTRLLATAPGDATDRVNRLVAGLDGVASASPTTALETLADELGPRAATLAAADAPHVLADFLARFGHRGLSEGELRAPAWEDDPAPLLAALRTLGGARHAAGFRRRARAELRRADEEALLARLGPMRRAVFVRVLERAQRWVRERERTKSAAVAMMHHGRRLARSAARVLVGDGRLRQADDVFFLTLDELIVALEGGALQLALLERRRRRYWREGALPAPRDVDLDAPQANAAPTDSDALRGIGVSAGIGLGPARVVDGSETPHLEPGEVLVARVLDAALGPLLARAAGAVAEIGGTLSHGSVVARELGVPCVVDVREATRRIRTGERVLVDGGAGRVEVVAEDTAVAALSGPPAILEAAHPTDEPFHDLEPHPEARESVYFNLQDPETGLAVVASVGNRPADRGEALLAIMVPDGRVLFGVDLAQPRHASAGISVGGSTYDWEPIRLRYDGRLATHESEGFPPSLLPLGLAPRTVAVSLDVLFVPTTPAVDFCDGLAPDVLARLASLGRHHVEQSGRWIGRLTVDGRTVDIDGTGSRDHSWGRRRWEAADHWRLFTLRLGPDLAVHALSVSVEGRLVEGGFLWRDGKAERVTRVEYAFERAAEGVRAVELDVATAAGPPLAIKGVVERTVAVPVDLERRRPLRLFGKRPYRLVLHENFTRYEALGRVGYGMAEITQRPL
jgi:phosphohistidine swiveling domain-containing protein